MTMISNNGSVVVSTLAPAPQSSDEILENLFPAIIQAFVIILAGYVAGRTGMVTQTQSKGISTFVSKFALPSLLLRNMIELNFSTVNWKFLCSLFLAKAIVFGTVLMFSLLLYRPLNFGKAAINAIFTTQSNDFAIGYPIAQAIYQNSYPEFLSYIYLAAPISLAILNPIGFLLMEIEKRRGADTHSGSRLGLVWNVVKDVITNPIVFMVVLGIIFNFIFQHNVPLVLTEILKVLGDSFSATALFYLGFTLVGKVQTLKGLGLIIPCLLIAAKMLLLPFITREMVYILDTGSTANQTQLYSMFGFLYGTFPSAPTVLIYATTYGVSVDIISTGMVLCTFVSAPLMFVSAKMVTLQNTDESKNLPILDETTLDISILSVVCTVWVAIVFILGRKWRVYPHQFVVFLLFSQFCACFGNILWHVMDVSVAWQHYIQFILFYTGVIASRTWTSMYAVGMCLLRVHSLCYVLRMRAWLIIYGFGVPVVCTGLLLMCAPPQWFVDHPFFQYGLAQDIVSGVISIISLIITAVALVIQQRNDRKHKTYKQLPNSEQDSRSGNNTDNQGVVSSSDNPAQCSNYGACCQDLQTKECDKVPATLNENRQRRQCRENSIEDIVPWSEMQTSELDDPVEDDGLMSESMCLSSDCSHIQRTECRRLLKKYHVTNKVESEADSLLIRQTTDEQIGHHQVLLFILIISMGIAVFLCVWRLFHEESSGVFIELEFLDTFFNFGQPFFVFAVFGLDTKLIIIPFIRRWRRLVYGAENIHLPRVDDLDEDTKHVCDQFERYHKEKCKMALERDRRYHLRVYKNVFAGIDLVAWLQEVGLASDDMEAVIYGQRLVLGRIIRHVTDEHQFYNLPYFYRFCEQTENV